MLEFLLRTVWLIPCYPLLGVVLALPWFPGIIRRTGPRPAGYISLLLTGLAFAHSLLALQGLWGQPTRAMLLPWLHVGSLALDFPLEISVVTLSACALVTGLNLAAQVYAITYMEMDWGWARLYALMALFESGMCALVLSDSLFFTYFILEILTLGTYLLVGFWFNQPLVVTGARDAFLTKRIGDLFLMMGVLAIWPLAGTFDFSELAIWAKTAQLDPTLATLLGLALIAGPIGKCAQFPLHLWLDEAMEGPLPSTILRSSVVVATGIWVLVKLYPVLALSPVVLTVMVTIGVISAIGGSLIALAQIDAKRALSFLVTAYMGLAFIAVGTGHGETALLLVLTHAVAMALLVMSLGSIIWNNVTQDLSQFGGLWARRPITGLAFLGGMVGLIALPPGGSFWAILALGDRLWATYPGLVGVLALVNLLATFGLARVFGLIFTGKSQPMTERSPESPWPIILPMVVLLGFVLHLPLLLYSWQLLPSWASINPAVATVLTVSSLIGLSGFWLKPIVIPWQPLHELLANDFYTTKIYRFVIVLPVVLAANLTAFLDRYFVDGLVNMISYVSVRSGQILRYSTNGQTQFYMLTVVVGVAFLMGMMMVL